MDNPHHHRYIQPDERSYGGFVPASQPTIEPIIQQLVEMQRGVAPSTTAAARIALLRKALTDAQEQRTPDFTPEMRATLLGALAVAYQQRLDGDRAQQMEAALVACEEALQVYTPAHYPYQYAGVQITLGNIYRERAVGTQRDNL